MEPESANLLCDFRSEHILEGFAATNEARAFAFDQHLRGTRARIVVGGERLAVGSGVEDGDQVAGLYSGKHAIAREEISGFADRSDDVGGESACAFRAASPE